MISVLPSLLLLLFVCSLGDNELPFDPVAGLGALIYRVGPGLRVVNIIDQIMSISRTIFVDLLGQLAEPVRACADAGARLQQNDLFPPLTQETTGEPLSGCWLINNGVSNNPLSNSAVITSRGEPQATRRPSLIKAMRSANSAARLISWVTIKAP